MRKGDRHNWSRLVGSQHRTDYWATTAALFARDYRRHPVSLGNLPSRCDAMLSGVVRR